ncbi:Flp pilus assembly protein CpaB [Burkholderia pyrrocinia]|uniref:Flp pilus assembly protein CpaB n=1 Tax=Burkholderia pyrrocinia TaxID=60550 RepID=UPI001FB6A1CC|nr:Flp pilus assembly protein CpaB [Burkholderia pyrrocinia]
MAGVAIVVAGGITFVVYKYLVDREAKIKAEVATQAHRNEVAVVVPRADVPAGTPLSSNVFVLRSIPKDLAYDDMIRAADFPKMRVLTLVKPIRQGRPLRAEDIDVLRARDFSDKLPDGQRALTLQIDSVNSTDSMLRPGNRVDLYWVGKDTDLEPEGQKNEQAIRLLLADVQVLATGTDTRPRDAGEAARDIANRKSGRDYSTVTLQVPVGEAARIVLAQKVGTLRLILRNVDDRDSAIPEKLTEQALFEAVKGARSDSVIEIISGGRNGGLDTTTIPGEPKPAPQPTRDGAHASADRQPGEKGAIALDPKDSPYQQANSLAKQLQSQLSASDTSQ